MDGHKTRGDILLKHRDLGISAKKIHAEVRAKNPNSIFLINILTKEQPIPSKDPRRRTEGL